MVVAPGAHRLPGAHDAPALEGRFVAGSILLRHEAVSVSQRERIGRERRLHNAREFAAVREGGTVFRGRAATLVVLPRPGEPTRVGFIASRRGVGNAVQRNRARRRLREILRRRWPRIEERGFWMVLVASRGALDAPHARLALELEGMLVSAGLMMPAAGR